jgi:flagellar biosynthetic protein FlhB
MAESDGQDKSEQPSEKKLHEGRDKGQVAKSVEINSLAIFSSGLIFIYFSRNTIGNKLSSFAIKVFSNLDKMDVSPLIITNFLRDSAIFFFAAIAPVILVIMAAGLISNISQVGFNFSMKALAPKFQKMNPLANIKKIFFSSRSFVEVLKSLVKLTIIGFFSYSVLVEFSLSATRLIEFTISEILSFMVETAFTLVWKIMLVFTLIALVDFLFQKFKFMKDMKMTKQEVKEESKSSEGDPLIKSRIRKLQYQMARRRMISEVPKADVIITNPTHFAVAIKYDMQNDSAPKVVAKGVDELAFRIKSVALKNNIPVHEDKLLARALYKLCDVGDRIPQDLFKAVAKILAYIYKMKTQNKKKHII